MVEWIEEKKYENIAGWLDRQEKQKDGWMYKTNRQVVVRKTKI